MTDATIQAMQTAPPVRVFDANLVRNIENSSCGVWEAELVRGLLAWMAHYERALKHIAAHGDADSAMLACRVLLGGE
ncbi:MAG: hypothetical protein Fur0019_17330 [Tibeticola sp.]